MLARRAKCLRPSCHWPTLLPKYSEKGFEHNLAACFQVRALDPRAMRAEGVGEVRVSVGTVLGEGRVSQVPPALLTHLHPTPPPRLHTSRGSWYLSHIESPPTASSRPPDSSSHTTSWNIPESVP